MRNIFRIFKYDLRSLYKNFFALLIVLAILVLPAMYAWFNIYAFWDPYGKTKDVEIAVVSDDVDYIDDDGNVINMGDSLIDEIKDDEHYGFVFLDDADQAVRDVYSGKYYAAVIIEPDFTYNMYNFLTTDTEEPTIKFYQNEKKNPVAVKVVESAGDKVKQVVNEQYISAVVSTLFDKLNAFSADMQGTTSVDALRSTLEKVRDNLQSYNGTIDKFITANNSLMDTLKRTNNTLNYSIYLLANERVNISDTVGYIDNTRSDLALINEEVGNMLSKMQKSVDDAVAQLGGGSDQRIKLQATLAELERQYQELIDYITHSGLHGAAVDEVLSALLKNEEKIQYLQLILAGQQTLSDADFQAILNDYNSVTELIYKLLTGYSTNDMSGQTTQSMVSFMQQDTAERAQSVQDDIALAQSADDNATRTAALKRAEQNAGILNQEVSALSTASEALAEAGGQSSNGMEETLAAAQENASTAESLLEAILTGNTVDLPTALDRVSTAISATNKALTQTVYPTLDTLLGNLQDSLGDLSSMLLQLNGVLGKVTPIVSELGNTFGAVNNALTQVKSLLNSYTGKIDKLIDLLDKNTEDGVLGEVLEFLNVDPESIGAFLSSPVTIESEAIYPVDSYGAAMTPFYTMLAIWVGCIILNAILRCEAPIPVEGATDLQRFFGRYMLFMVLGQIQSLIIILGDIFILGVNCVHPGLMILAGAVASLACTMLFYGCIVALGNIGRGLMVVFLIVQIAGSGGSYPIELLPNFFRQAYLFFPFPYAINAMREAIAGLYQMRYFTYLLQLMLFFLAGMLLGIFIRRSLHGINGYMNERLKKTEMM